MKFALAAAAALSAATLVHAQPPHLTAVGDSLTDEYAEEVYGPVGKSWTEILVQTGRADFGPTAAQAGLESWGEPRRTGYKDNWARYSWTASGGALFEAPGAATSVSTSGAQYAIVFIGGNDFRPGTDAYTNMYFSAWSTAQADAYIDSIVDQVRVIVQTLRGAQARVVIVSPPDFGFMGFMRNGYPDPNGRAHATYLYSTYRDRLRALAMQNGAAFVDIFQLNQDFFGDARDLAPVALVGNVPIALQQAGATGAFGTVPDGIHPQRVVQSIWCEAIITALDSAFQLGIPHISEAEMLAIGGLRYAGADTLPLRLRPFSWYVATFPCTADFNRNGLLTIDDLMDYLNAWFAGSPACDVDATPGLTVFDLMHYLNTWFSGCG